MYFKKAGCKIQVLAYRGYDKVKKSPIVKMIGSISGYDFNPSVGQENNIKPEEKAEIKEYISKMCEADSASRNRDAMKYLDSSLRSSVQGMKEGNADLVTEKWAEAVWHGIDDLGRLLRKSGYGKHKTIRHPKENTTNEQSDSKTKKKQDSKTKKK